MRKYDAGPFQNESESSSCIFLIIIHKLRVRCPFFIISDGGYQLLVKQVHNFILKVYKSVCD